MVAIRSQSERTNGIHTKKRKKWQVLIRKRFVKNIAKTFRDLGSGFVYLLFGQLSKAREIIIRLVEK